MRRFVRSALLAIITIPTGPALSQTPSDDLRRASDGIEPAAVYGYCKALCSPDYEGRLTGTRGYKACADWAAGKFKAWGLRPMPTDGTYLQDFPAPHCLIDEAAMVLLLPEPAGSQPPTTQQAAKPKFREAPLKLAEEFFPLLYSDSGDHEADIVFAGWGIHAPDLGYDDYAGLDANSKFVLCFRGTPEHDDNRFMHHDQHRTRMQTAQKLGAVGLIYIEDGIHVNPNGEWLEGFLPASITEQAAGQILAERKMTSTELRGWLEKTKRPQSFTLSSRIHLSAKSRHFPNAVAYNVVGIVPGADRGLADECVVIGAHLDACGKHAGLLFAGAEDNASGAAAVMAAAEAFAGLRAPPKRSVVFVLIGGEEMGLLGSTHFAKNLPPPFKNIHAMLNLDMVGEGDGLHLGYTANGEGLKTALDRADRIVRTVRSSTVIQQVGVRSSDYAPFFELGAPCAGFYSNGPHLSYHQAGDTIYRINPDMLGDVARLVFLATYYWADSAPEQTTTRPDRN
jgi:hypothetical protein